MTPRVVAADRVRVVTSALLFRTGVEVRLPQRSRVVRTGGSRASLQLWYPVCATNVPEATSARTCPTGRSSRRPRSSPAGAPGLPRTRAGARESRAPARQSRTTARSGRDRLLVLARGALDRDLARLGPLGDRDPQP